MITIGSDHSAIYGIFKLAVETTIGLKVYDWLREGKSKLLTADLVELLEDLKFKNQDLHLIVEKYISKSSIQGSSYIHKTIPTGIPKTICLKLSKIDIGSSEFGVSGEDRRYISNWVAHTRSRIYPVDFLTKNEPFLFSADLVYIKKGEIILWPSLFSKFRHKTSSITIQDQYVSEGTEVVEFIKGLITNKSALKEIIVITKAEDPSKPRVKLDYQILYEKLQREINPDLELKVFRFSEQLAKELIHNRFVITDSVVVKLDRGINIRSKNNKSKFNGPIEFCGKYHNGGLDYDNYNATKDDLLKHPEISIEIINS